jgi:hypothetical protein
MKLRSRGMTAVALFGVCAAIGTAAAQPAATPGGDVKAGSAVAPGDQLAQTDQIVSRMQVSATRVRHMLDDARRQKDVVKTTCLSDKVAQLEVALKSARERQGTLKSAAARGDTDLRNHEFSVLGVLYKRKEQLDAEANQCIGEEIGMPGETKNEVTIDPNIAPVDPQTPDPGTGTVVYSPPLPASGFQ